MKPNQSTVSLNSEAFMLHWKYVVWITFVEAAWRNSQANIPVTLFIFIYVQAVCWHMGIGVQNVVPNLSLIALYQSSDF